jgi:membrane-associated phospholipid phosphatase
MLRGARVFGRTIRWAVTAMSIVIIASTLLVKQHVLADVVGGILAGELLYRSAGIALSYLAVSFIRFASAARSRV